MRCSHVVIDEERGSLVCSETGEVLEESILDLRPDWRAYTPEEWNSRAHANPITYTVHDAGLATEIDLSVKKYRESVKNIRLALTQRKTRVSKSERKLVEALSSLNRISALLGLPDQVKETAGIILRKILLAVEPRANKLALAAAIALILAARKHGLPLRAKEVLSLIEADEEEYWDMMSEVHFKADLSEFKAFIDPRRYLPLIVSNLGLSQQTYLLAAKIIDVLKRGLLTEGKDPVGIAAAVVYISSIIMDEKKAQKQVAQAANVTEVTVRNRYRDIIDKLLITVHL